MNAPSFRIALRYWFVLGCISFGGPAGQIAMMHRELVERRRWISDGHFLHALNFCMLLPGPEAQQLATYLGWRLHGLRGALAAGVLFVLPSAVLLYALSWMFMTSAGIGWVAAIFGGLLPAVVALVISAVIRIGRKALKTRALLALAAAAFVAVSYLKVPFVIVVAAAAIIGAVGRRFVPAMFPAADGHKGGQAAELECVSLPPVPVNSWRRVCMILVVGLVVWWSVPLALGAWLGWGHAVFAQGIFFSKAALVTFGGAYAVLPYVAEQAVQTHGWLSQSQMMSGLALAETTPGPLIMVLQFVGYVGAWQHPGTLSPHVAATLGALVTTWVTFTPGILMILLGAPHVETLRSRPLIAAALAAITAAVVGVILNLGIWMAWRVISPSGTLDVFAAVCTVLALLALQRKTTNPAWVIAACAAAGLVRYAVA